MHIPMFKISTITQLCLLIQQGDYAFSMNLKDAYLQIPIIKDHHHYYSQFGNIDLINGRF